MDVSLRVVLLALVHVPARLSLVVRVARVRVQEVAPALVLALLQEGGAIVKRVHHIVISFVTVHVAQLVEPRVCPVARIIAMAMQRVVHRVRHAVVVVTFIVMVTAEEIANGLVISHVI